MVCRHCPRPPWRPALLAFLFPPLLLSLALAAAHRATVSTPPPPTSLHYHSAITPTDTHAHRNDHHQRNGAIIADWKVPQHSGNESQCAAATNFEIEKVPQEKVAEKCQTCPRENETCDSCRTLVEAVCYNKEPEEREQLIRRVTLRYCPHLVLQSVMCPLDRESVIHSINCSSVLRHLQERDEQVARILQQHRSIVHNCERSYSMREKCTGCEEAYKYWVCSQLFPYYDNGKHIKPCRQFCHEVEQKCPYLLPKDKPVAGEPTFLCEDPAIGELESQESSYGKDSCCYKLSTHLQPMCSPNENPAERHPPVLCSTCPTTSGTQERPSDNQCLSAIGADPSLRQSHSSTAAPSSSGSCSVISRKHCWTRTALSILLLCLVRTRVWLPRGFT
ncbi:uncharacterized protein LOC122242156 [Penaeus japonicus]|uniref:uncharacterized protein LOC122242156 n=1 Tax=Penaeus japonicus TaxID=27405 RepID=UPI001C711CAD|nr:uncharacterized protein LOC122242156 [Penaeus japonicus]